MDDDADEETDDADDEVWDLASFTDLLRTVEGRANQLSIGMVDGRVLPPSDARAYRTGFVAHLRDEVLPRVSPHRALQVLDVLARRHFDDLDHLRPSFEAARATRDRPPPPASWPELDAIRALGPPLARLPPGISHTGFVADLAARGASVPDELLALLAATDGLALTRRATGTVVLSLLPSTDLEVVVQDDTPTLVVARWPTMRFGFTSIWMILWLEHGELTGATEVRHAGQRPEIDRFSARRLDLPALLRFALAQVEAPAIPGEAVADEIAVDLKWRWFFARDAERFDLLVSAGRISDARALCDRIAADLLEDADSCTRVGDHGAATKAERARDVWLARARTLP